MSEQRVLAAFYEGWANYQRLMIEALVPLSSEQLDLEVAPHLRSVLDIATHIVGARARWLVAALEEGVDELQSIAEWDRPDQPARSAAELVGALEDTWRVMHGAMGRWTPAEWSEPFDRTYRGETRTHTRQWVIWHLLEHDLHHGGELSFVLGSHGLRAIDL